MFAGMTQKPEIFRGCARVARSLGATALLFLAAGPTAVQAQSNEFGSGGDAAVEIARVGAARVLEAVGPPLFGRREFYRPVPPLELRHRWVVVQDSTSGVVFTAPSGVKQDLDTYVADVHLRSLQGIRAIELRSLVFNVWGELSGYLGTTVLTERRPGDRWDLQPRWRSDDLPTQGHRTSILWVNRVMFDDESILEADLEPIAAAWSRVTGSAFEGLPEGMPWPALGP